MLISYNKRYLGASDRENRNDSINKNKFHHPPTSFLKERRVFFHVALIIKQFEQQISCKQLFSSLSLSGS